MPTGAWCAHVLFGVPLPVRWRGAWAALLIAALSVPLSGVPASVDAAEAASAPIESRSRPPGLRAGQPLDDLEGLRAQQTPTPEDDIPDVSLTLGGPSHTVDVVGYFSDRVNRYDVTAAPNGIVRTSRSGTVITIEPLAAGSATVTVRGRKVGGSERKRFTVTVSAAVAAPTATGTIAALTLTEGGTHAVTASDYFEGEGMTYTASSSETGAATVDVAGVEVTVTAVGAGSATVTVTATNAGGSAGQSFAVTVLTPAPATVGSIEGVTLTEGATQVVDASDYFSGAGITYSAGSSNDAVATVEVEASTVTVTAVAPGSATVTVTAMNAGGSAGQSFAVTVQLPAVTLTRGDTRTLELAGHFGAGVTGYDASVSPAGIVELAVSGSQLTLTALAIGKATVTLGVTSADGAAEHRFGVTVLPPAPLAVGSIEAVTLTDGETHVEDAADYFSGEGITYTARSSNDSVAAAGVVGSAVTVTAVAAGEATVTVTATNAGGSAAQSFAVTVELPSITLTKGGALTIELADYFGDDVTGYRVTVSQSGIVHLSRSGSQLTLTGLAAGETTVTVTAANAGGSAQQAFAVTVSPPAPTAVGSIEGVTLTEGATRVVDASAYFEGEGVTYTAESSEDAVASVEVAGAAVTVTAVAAGETTVTVTATNAGGSAQQAFAVTVSPPAPTRVGSIEGVTLTEGATHVVDASAHFEGEGVTYTAESSEEAVASVEVSGASVTVTAVAAGSATVTVTATNAGGSAQQAFAVTVSPPAPTAVGSVEGVTLTEGAARVVDASVYFEGAGVTYTAESSEDAVASVGVEGAAVTVTAVAAGSATVTVTATNAGGSAEQAFAVTVVPPAPAPVGSIEGVTLTEGATHFVDASAHFEGEGVTYTARSSEDAVASVGVEGASVTVTAVAAGSATVTVTATNAGGSAEQAFAVTVVPPAPTRVGSIEGVTLTEGSTHVVDASVSFKGDGVTYTAESSDTEVATVEVAGASVTVTAVAAGSATVTVTATNGGGSAEQAFAVTVVPPAPATVVSIEDASLRGNGAALEVELPAYFGGAIDRYEVSAEPPGFVHVWESGGRLTVTALASGLATVTATATNAGGVARQTFLVTVQDAAPRALGRLPLAAIIEGDYSIVSASAYFEGEGATYTAESSNGDVAAVAMHGESVLVRALAVGIALVTVSAANEGGSATQEFVVVVLRRGPRVLDGVEDLTLTAGGAVRTIDLSDHFFGSVVRYGASAEPAGIVHLWESDGRLTLTPFAAGSTTVTVWSTNSGGTATQTFEVKVRPRAPRALASRTLLSLSMDGPPLTVELANYIGGAVERYELAATPGGVVHLWESGGALTLTPLAAGLARVEVTALNEGGGARQSFTVVVQPAGPVALGHIVGAPLAAGGVGQEIALADYFAGEVADYGVASRPGGVLHLWQSRGRLRLTPLSAGVATVTVTATNGSGSAVQVFAVAVGPAAPSVLGGAERIALAEGGAARELDLGDYFGGEAARYHLSADPGGVVHGWESGGRLTLTPLAAGVATLGVTATNSAGSAEQLFVVAVVAAAPAPLGRIEGITLSAAGEARELELVDYFSGAGARYRGAADPVGVAHVWVSEGRLRLTPLAAGEATVTVTASNEGGSARQEFAVRVE